MGADGTTASALAEIRRSYDQGLPLPGRAYRDPGVYEEEVSELFRHGWIGVACGQSVPEPGDLFPVRICGWSLLLVRDRSREVRVFYNLCRHRGAPLAQEACRARAGRIVCPYHAWSYQLDGRFASAPHFRRGAGAGPDPAEAEGLGLLPLRAALWRDVVFVNPSGDAPPFEQFIRPLDERIAPWAAAELRPLGSDEYEVRANWKLAAENFLDNYHLAVVHPQIGGGFEGALLTEDVVVSDDIVGLIMPQGYGKDSDQAGSRLPRFPGLRESDRLRIEVFSIFPNTLLLVEPDNQQVIVLRPQGPGLTHETFANYVVSDASQSEALAVDRAELQQAAVEINDQDVALLLALQRSRSMDAAGETRHCEAWDETNRRFQRLWARRLLAAR